MFTFMFAMFATMATMLPAALGTAAAMLAPVAMIFDFVAR